MPLKPPKDYPAESPQGKKNKLARDQYHARIPKVDARVLKAARADPRYEERQGIADYVICRVCGAPWKNLGPKHIPLLHGGTRKYRSQFPGAPIMCSSKRAELSSQQERDAWRLRNDPNAGNRYLTGDLRDWVFLCLHLGEPVNIEEKLLRGHRFSRRVWRKVRHMGLHLEALGKGGPGRRDLGELATNGWVKSLRGATGLTAREFAEWSNSDPKVVNRSGRRYRIASVQADLIIRARNTFLGQIAELAQRPGRRWNPSLARVLRSLIPYLPEKWLLLRTILRETRSYFQNYPGSQIEDWQNWICNQARGEKKGFIAGNLFRRFLTVAPAVCPFLDKKAMTMPPLRGREAVNTLEALRILAQILGIPASANAIADCSTALPHSPIEVRNLVISARPLGRPPDKKIAGAGGESSRATARRSRKPKPAEERTFAQIARQVEAAIEGSRSKKSIVAARHFISERTGIPFDTVAQYHKRWFAAKKGLR
jgi:hypothetical protein